MKKMHIVFALLAACFVANAAQALPRIDELIGQLSGSDEPARSLARQLLPRYGVDAVPFILPLADNENANISWAAFKVLGDIACDLDAPSHRNDKRRMAGYVMTLLSAEHKAPVKREALKLTMRVVPPNFDVAPIAALFGDAELRETARGALVEIGTAHAHRALAAALEQADAPFKVSLLQALAALHDGASLPKAEGLAHASEPAVRAAAAFHLAWTGELKYLATLKSVRAQADDATRFDAGEAFLRFADVVAKRGGNWGVAMAIYRDVLATDTNDALRGAAIAGIGTNGDDSAAAEIVAAVQGEHGVALQAPAVAALERVQGLAGAKALIAVYPKLPAPMRGPMLCAFGRRAEPLFIPFMQDAAKSQDATLRTVAYEALATSRMQEAIDPLAAALTAAPKGPEQDTLREYLWTLATDLQRRGQGQGTGKAYLALYRAAPSDEERKKALDGVMQNPTPEAYDVLMAVATPEQRAALPAPVLAGVAQSLLTAKRTKDAYALVDGLLAKSGDPAVANVLVPLTGPLGAEYGLTRKLGFLTKWYIVGPFPWTQEAGFQKPEVDPKHVDLAAKYPGKNGEAAWKQVTTADPGGLVELTGNFGMIDHATAFAYTTIRVAAETDATLRLGSDDGIRAFVNGDQVHANPVDRGTAIDSDLVKVHLKAGENQILLQITQNGGGWNFLARITKTDGTTLTFQD